MKPALFSRSDKTRFAVLVAVMVGGTLLECATLGAVPLFVASVTSPEKSEGAIRILTRLLGWLGIREIPSSQLPLWGGAVLAGVYIVRTVYLLGSYALQERILRNRQIALGSRLFKVYMNAPYAYHLQHNSNTIIANVTFQVREYINQYLDPTLNIVRNSVAIAAIVGFILWYNPAVSLGAIVLLGCTTAAFHFSTQRTLRRNGERMVAAEQQAVRAASEGIGSLREAQIYDQKDYFGRRLHQSLQQWGNVMKRQMTIQRSIWPIMELITVLVLLGVMGVMFGLHGGDTATIASTIALIALALARLKGLLSEGIVYASMRKGHAALQDVLVDTFAELPAVDDTPREGCPPQGAVFNNALELQGVSFSYDGTRDILHDVSLRIPAGASLALVGSTGAGKSTLAAVLLGLLQPTKGMVCVDGTPLDTEDALRSWQGQLGFVPQDPFLLDDSIAENISLGRKAATPDALQAALDAAQLTDVIGQLPDGVSTVVGERGVHLSGGQRQRVALARALYSAPPVIVLDEATSALDATTEAAVAAAIGGLRGKHTLIIIAHRLSTIRNCDKIVFLKNGSIAGAGTYDELRESVPEFRAMTLA